MRSFQSRKNDREDGRAAASLACFIIHCSGVKANMEDLSTLQLHVRELKCSPPVSAGTGWHWMDGWMFK